MLQWLFGSQCEKGTGWSLHMSRDRKDLCEESHKAKVVGAVCLW